MNIRKFPYSYFAIGFAMALLINTSRVDAKIVTVGFSSNAAIGIKVDSEAATNFSQQDILGQFGIDGTKEPDPGFNVPHAGAGYYIPVSGSISWDTETTSEPSYSGVVSISVPGESAQKTGLEYGQGISSATLKIGNLSFTSGNPKFNSSLILENNVEAFDGVYDSIAIIPTFPFSEHEVVINNEYSIDNAPVTSHLIVPWDFFSLKAIGSENLLASDTPPESLDLFNDTGIPESLSHLFSPDSAVEGFTLRLDAKARNADGNEFLAASIFIVSDDISPSAVPIPGALPFFIFAIGSILMLTRRKINRI